MPMMPKPTKPAKPTIVKLLVTLNVPAEIAKENFALFVAMALNKHIESFSAGGGSGEAPTPADPHRDILFGIKRHTPPRRFHAKSTVKRAKVVKLARKHKR